MTTETGRVLCEASVVHRGSTVAAAESRVYVEEGGKLIAHGTTTCLLLSANAHNGSAPTPDPARADSRPPARLAR